jgi:hypothetical protein
MRGSRAYTVSRNGESFGSDRIARRTKLFREEWSSTTI